MQVPSTLGNRIVDGSARFVCEPATSEWDPPDLQIRSPLPSQISVNHTEARLASLALASLLSLIDSIGGNNTVL